MPTKLQNGYLPKGSRKNYQADIVLSWQDFSDIFDFACDMAYGNGHHRANRSGGSIKRHPDTIFQNVFEGKIGEFALYRHLEKNGILVTPPDCSVHKKGVWDGGDFQFRNSFELSVKTSKHFSQLLLLESKDYNVNQETGRVVYLPDNHTPDAIIFMRTCNDMRDFLKNKDNWKPIRECKKEMYIASKITCEVTGYITNKDLKNLIEHDFIIKKGSYLNGKTKMDADNYYIPAKDMKTSEHLVDTLNKIKVIHEQRIEKERQSKLKLSLNM